MEQTGSIKVIGETKQVSDKFKLREFVITTADTYPQHISFQATQDKCALLDTCKIGEQVTVHFNLRGREWNSPAGETKYFNTLEAWKINKGTAEYAAPNTPAMQTGGDLPF